MPEQGIFYGLDPLQSSTMVYPDGRLWVGTSWTFEESIYLYYYSTMWGATLGSTPDDHVKLVEDDGSGLADLHSRTIELLKH